MKGKARAWGGGNTGDSQATGEKHSLAPENLFGGVGDRWSPFANPPPPPPMEGGSKGRLSLFHVFHAYSMTKPLALSQSFPVPVTVSLRGGGGGVGTRPRYCLPFGAYWPLATAHSLLLQFS